jgi:hypothetical protein
MNKFESVTKRLMWFLPLLLIAFLAGCGGGQDTVLGSGGSLSSAKSITAFSFAGFPANPGVINEAAKTIAVSMPSNTVQAALTAKFTTTGASVSVVATGVQTSGTTANNFTAPVSYTVTAADGSTATYTVTVTLLPSNVTAITAFSFAGYPANPGVINEPAKTITVTLPFGTNLATLTNAVYASVAPTVKVAAVTQTSGAGPQTNFSAGVAYTVTAADGVSTETYNVTVLTLPSNITAITAFSFAGYPANPGVINEAFKTITVTLPSGTNLAALTNAVYATVAPSVKVAAVAQTSGAGPQVNFSAVVPYTVTAADGVTTETYNVTVLALPNNVTAITAFSFAGYPADPGVVSEVAKTVTVALPFGTNLATLTDAIYATVAPTVKVGAVTQTSGAGPQIGFSAMVPYIVTAADGVTTETYDVTVSTLANNATAITAFSFAGYPANPGVINEGAKTITVTLPAGTNLATLTNAVYATVAPTVAVSGVAQTTGIGPQIGFSGPVPYKVTAADGVTTETYNVTVTDATVPAINLKSILTNNFVVLATTQITEAIPASGAITGNIGLSPATAAQIFVACSEMTGNIYGANVAYTGSTGGTGCFKGTSADNTTVANAVLDLGTAYTAASAPATPAAVDAQHLNLLGGVIPGGTVFTPGVYTWGSDVNINGNITLDGGPNDVWIFQISGKLAVASAGSLATGTQVILSGGAQASNIFWQVGGQSVTLGTYSTFNGVILTSPSTLLAMQTGAVLHGRALSGTEVTLQGNTVGP